MSRNERFEVRETMAMWAMSFFVGSTIVCAIGWFSGIEPKNTDWAVVASLGGAIFTGGAALFAVVTYNASLRLRRDEELAERYSMARRVVYINELRLLEPCAKEYAEYAASLGVEDKIYGPSLTRAQRDGYDGPYNVILKATISNFTSYPVFDVAVIGPNRGEDGQFVAQGSEREELGTLVPNGESVVHFRPEQISKPNSAELKNSILLQFTDMWGQSWRTDVSGTSRETVLSPPPAR